MPARAVKPSPIEQWVTNAAPGQLHAVSGAAGGFASGVVTCPLDVIKVRLQSQGSLVPVRVGPLRLNLLRTAKRSRSHHGLYKGFMHTARLIWREEGVRGMYRGMGPLLLGYLPTWGIYFTVYQQSKRRLPELDLQLKTRPNLVNILSSLAAGSVSTLVTTPIWAIKVRLMSQAHRPCRQRLFRRNRVHRPHWHYHSTLDAAYKMFTTEGLGAFYSGLGAGMLGLTHVAIQFPTYEYLKKRLNGSELGTAVDREVEWFGILSASVLSKVIAGSLTYPHEVIRTRLHTQRRPIPGAEFLEGLGGFASQRGFKSGSMLLHPKYQGVFDTYRVILREEGWRAFYKGMGVNVARSVPAAIVTMMSYEYAMSFLLRMKEDTMEDPKDLSSL
ncbi:related to folate transporter/carrier (mitochondrial) [Fusarium torulosum]|uniref:Related to folate transporter/carrier (Mitochondrial) n=1 Tax=Fusarium torulosum TaxID=33205 RepID=A0AAE8LXP4_9HYPO|nr:related to folate transporter/carrier (mitochondrial) [Fusarium torulosum]